MTRQRSFDFDLAHQLRLVASLSKIPDGERKLLTALALFAASHPARVVGDDEGETMLDPSRAEIAQAAGCSVSTVKSWLRSTADTNRLLIDRSDRQRHVYFVRWDAIERAADLEPAPPDRRPAHLEGRPPKPASSAETRGDRIADPGQFLTPVDPGQTDRGQVRELTPVDPPLSDRGQLPIVPRAPARPRHGHGFSLYGSNSKNHGHGAGVTEWPASISGAQLRDPATVDELFGLAVACGWQLQSEQRRFDWFTLAAKACRVGKNPGALFVQQARSLAEGLRGATIADEDWARQALQSLDRPPPLPATAAAAVSGGGDPDGDADERWRQLQALRGIAGEFPVRHGLAGRSR
jgi:hypothetical protein